MSHEHMVDANAVLDRMRQTLGVATDTALCTLLGVGSSVVSTWRHRNHVPYEECAILALRNGVSLDWLVFGQAPTPHTAEPAPPACGDPRVTRMLRFIEAWPMGRDSDDVAWLERTLARNVQEYGQWLASQPTPQGPSTTERPDKPGP